MGYPDDLHLPKHTAERTRQNTKGLFYFKIGVHIQNPELGSYAEQKVFRYFDKSISHNFQFFFSRYHTD